MLIAIDGPAASGKGTLARRLAAHLGYAYLDTGLLYRAVGMAVARAGGDPADGAVATAAAVALDPESAEVLAAADLRSDRAAAAASQVAAIPGVRAALLAFQRRFAARPPGGAAGAVLDGRDIGTVVCPDAPAKLFITASLAVRVERRVKELQERGHPAIVAEVLEEMKARDARDSQRDAAPLRPADDAQVLDTSDLSADAVFAAAVAFVSSRLSP